jgi:hypothetical protein
MAKKRFDFAQREGSASTSLSVKKEDRVKERFDFAQREG